MYSLERDVKKMEDDRERAEDALIDAIADSSDGEVVARSWTFLIERPKWKADDPDYVVMCDVLAHYTRYTITLDGKAIRKQISVPSLLDCEQGEYDRRSGSRPAGFTP